MLGHINRPEGHETAVMEAGAKMILARPGQIWTRGALTRARLSASCKAGP